MEKTVASNNRASIGGHVVEKVFAIFLDGIRFVCSIVIFNICHVFHGIGPELLISAITQNMVLVSTAQFFNRDVKKIVINNDVVKLIGNFEGVIKTSISTIIDRDFVGPGCSSSNSTKKDDRIVVGRGVVKDTIEVSDIAIEGGFDVAVVNFYG